MVRIASSKKHLARRPGSCPICGMALEPRMPTLEAGLDPELEALTDEERRDIQAKLENQLEEARRQLEGLRGSSAPVSLDLSIGRLSRVDAMQQQQMASATRRRVEVEIGQITAALRRIHGTSYGECALCGGDIGRRRLLARPATPYCRHCEEERSRRA